MSSQKKFTDFPDGGAVQATDEFLAARAGASVKIAGSALGGGSSFTEEVTIAPAVADTTSLEITPHPGGTIGWPAFGLKKYDGSGTDLDGLGYVTHFDDDGGGVLGRMKFSELGTFEIFSLETGHGNNIFSFHNLGQALFAVASQGGGYNVSISSGDPGDVMLILGPATGQTADQVQNFDESFDRPRFRINKAGYPVLANNAAPADGDLAANELALWFDSTDGAGKLKLKAKTADGTVVTGSVNLT